MRLTLRRRLLAVVVFAAVACGGALFAILRLARSSTEQHLERVRDGVVREVDRLRDAAEAGSAPLDAPPLRRRGGGGRAWLSGYFDSLSPGMAPGGADGGYRGLAFRQAWLAAAQASDATRGEIAVRETRANAGGTIVVGTARLPGRGPPRYAWAAARVPAQREAAAWRGGVWVLAIATLALVLASLQALVAFERGATTLRAALGGLARDLRAPVARPTVRELGDVADGIASLASALASSQDERTVLLRELAERERLAALGRVVAGVAHEVRNPLAAIKLRADLAQRGQDVPAAIARDLADIANEVARLDRLVADLLVVSGRRVGPRAPADLGELARKRVELLRPWAAERGVTLAVAGGAPVTLDADGVARVIDNLVRNAVDAAGPGGVVRVTAAAADAHGGATLTVSDTGPGVPPARVAELFEPFFTTKPDGTGLGLALSRAIALAHGGTLTYERDEHATRFVLALPGVSSNGAQR